MRPDQLESAFGMNADRTGIGGIADHGDHLPVAARLAFSDQPLQQLQTNAAARSVYERCGFRVVGHDGAARKAGRDVPVLVMQADQPRSATT